MRKGRRADPPAQRILSVERDEQGYRLQVNGETLMTKKLVIASGGLSMPGLGASPFGYKVAEQFGLKVLPTRAGLVPFTLHKPLLRAASGALRRFGAFYHYRRERHPVPRKSAVYPSWPFRAGGAADIQLLAARRVRHC
ncbi:NAD(P)/FAD-dependent oxidoreductase [Klebsiella variicola subsp. variicola]|nr:NAD(P)/FAD-dependent oxidoreductase [Klebsiella variicola subsp. variicola]